MVPEKERERERKMEVHSESFVCAHNMKAKSSVGSVPTRLVLLFLLFYLGANQVASVTNERVHKRNTNRSRIEHGKVPKVRL